MAIRRNISVLNPGIIADINIVQGSDLIPIEFYITDYVLPDDAIAILYCETSGKQLLKDVGTITNNVISFNPANGFFAVGKNNLQIRITADEKNLYTFEMGANCKPKIATDDAQEVESQPTLVDQLLTKTGEAKALAEQIQEQNEEAINEFKTNIIQLSNPNLFINGNFQIWSNEESFEVYGTNNEGSTTNICDKWYAKHYDLFNKYYITKAEAQGIRLFSTSEKPCSIYQILDEETFNALQGKTVTLSWSYTQSYGDANHVEYETIEESKKITVIEDLDVFTAMTRIGFTSGIDGCIIHWIKMEVGELKTPCVPDSKDAIICRLEKQIDEFPIGTFTISGVMSKSNWTQRILVYQLPLGIDTSGYNISCSQLTACVNQSQYEAEIYQCVFQHDSIWVATLDANVEGCYAFAEITITKK